ncbi:alpha-L-arabinofuranosidase [Solitalea longa]|uniref:Alpha-L-arabinofuranosidase n=1 Tax=Solitalea longa TaxID=2079460 RepID=A0A2S5A567_9SPHI|nr:alpha-L-arabinofuranosidase [Solitalea longa]POY37462.1 alpha-L-arabinofuranosidase [Solitalea longa]
MGYKTILQQCLVTVFVAAAISSCSKGSPDNDNPTPGGGDDNITPPTEVPASATSGFFMDDWAPRKFTAPQYDFITAPLTKSSVTITADYSQSTNKVSKYIFGNNTNPYIGQMVTEPTLLGHLRELSPNIIRFPGGNISSIYFWNRNQGAKPADAPDKLLYENNSVDAGYWYGNNNDGWTLSVNNFYNMLAQVGSTAIITVNYSYARYGLSDHPDRAAAHLAADWVRADKGKTKFWEIGNESSGPWQAGFKIDVSKNKDGQPEIINGTIYGKHFKVFADSMRKAATEVGANIKIGAQLVQYDATNSWNVVDRTWNAEYFAAAGDYADYYIVHDYYTPLGANTGADEILNSAVKISKDNMDRVKASMQQGGVPQKPIALTEWNIGAEGNKQMISNLNGLHAAIVLGELVKNNYGMASRWDIANGYNNGNDMGSFSMGDDGDGVTKWSPRPSFYYMYYFQKYFGDRMFSSSVSGSNSNILTYASSFSNGGDAGLVLVNKGTSSEMASVELKNFKPGARYYYYVLQGGEGGDFSRKVLVNGQGPSAPGGGPLNYSTLKARSAKLTSSSVKLELPARSVVYLIMEKAK